MPRCYLCNEPAVGVEHVPPRCIFPKAKDLPEGVNLRQNLMTVPSCEAHNSEKSSDDVYFLNVITSLDCINDVGKEHYKRQIRRQHKRNPSILARFAERALSIAGRFGHEVEIHRLDNFAEHLGYALFLAHFGNRWNGSLGWVPEFLARAKDPDPEPEQLRLEVIEENNREFRDVLHHGSNPTVFSYQIIECERNTRFGCIFTRVARPFSLSPKLKTAAIMKHNMSRKPAASQPRTYAGGACSGRLARRYVYGS